MGLHVFNSLKSGVFHHRFRRQTGQNCFSDLALHLVPQIRPVVAFELRVRVLPALLPLRRCPPGTSRRFALCTRGVLGVDPLACCGLLVFRSRLFPQQALVVLLCSKLAQFALVCSFHGFLAGRAFVVCDFLGSADNALLVRDTLTTSDTEAKAFWRNAMAIGTTVRVFGRPCHCYDS